MVERRVCTFCGVEIEPGTGRMYVRKDGVTYNFCSSKCFKNLVELGRVPRRVTWTRHYEREKKIRLKSAPEKAASKKVRKVKKAEAGKDETKEAKPEPAKETDAPSEETAGDLMKAESSKDEEA